MITTEEVRTLLGAGGAVTGTDGDKIGKIGQVFLDDQTGEPEWVTVKTGMFGSGESFVPLAAGNVSGDDIQVPYSKDMVKDAPRVDDSEGHLSPDQETELYRYYGLDTADATDTISTDSVNTTDTNTTGTAYPAGDADRDTRQDRTGQEGIVGRDTSGPTTDDAMTRSEERLHVGTEKVQTGKARLRKYVVTENVTQTVPVSHEEVRLEREPITDANVGDARSGKDLSSEEHEVTLTEERVVVSKETVPVERVKLGTETVTEEQQVEETIGKEQIDLDDSELNDGSPAHRAN